ncbi:ribonuclease H-like YkuK family protein [Paenibacillus ehimensis]|uniref:Ribonuclease H-like YkuK family protein n=1 Tax=Paenibacillus ehimensis TaxID=79264 RepID=A0ABT8VEV9_9BACL|nr:ribonuclease H-like YkuK family protein [Paenibacillus ehimensis]MDO3679508.1 ribonuclease H-like YkuK family protein [Paenibacillus ehimensis]MEC0207508.1 ribonuclease H-like YkuK family protein [Paenibacillus ehimensis]
MMFLSPTRGSVALEEMVKILHDFVQEDQEASYKLVIGTDSHTTRRSTTLVTAVIIHRIGKGARFFYRKRTSRPLFDLRTRIYRETELSLELVELLNRSGMSDLTSQWPLEIHIDIGQQGETKVLIQEICGWVTSVGYEARIKPMSFGASSVADRFAE